MNICVLANQLLSPNLASGGDVLSVEILKKIPGHLTIVAPKISHLSLQSEIKRAEIISSDNGNIRFQSNLIGGIQVLYIYLKRSINTSLFFLSNHNYDALYLTGDFICNSIPVTVYKILFPKIKIFSNFYHLNPVPWKRENRYIFSLISLILQRFSLFLIKLISNHIFVLTSEGKEILVSLGFNKDKISISGAAVSTKCLEKNIGTNKIYDLLFVGRLNKTKGIYDAVKILRLVKLPYPNIKLAIVGSCTDSELLKIKNILRRYNLEKNFKYLGFVSEKIKYQLMRSTPVLLAPSYEEGFGMGVLEGIASGMKVAAYRLPVYKLIFNKYKKNIKYSQIGDIPEMSKIVTEYLGLRKKANKPINVPTWDNVAHIQYRCMSRITGIR